MSEIRIQPPSDELIPGEAVQIPIVLVLDEPTRARGLHATFHGAEETKATYTTYNAANNTTQTHTAVEHIDIVKAEFLLTGNERKGFFGNLADAVATMFGGGEHELLDPGEYPFEVTVEVPPGARASFAGEKCRVFYELSVLLDIPLGRDLKATCAFQVAGADKHDGPTGPVRTCYPDDAERGFFDSLLGPDVRIEAALRERCPRAGDRIEGIFVVESVKPLDYRRIDVRLITVESTTAHSHDDSHVHQGEPQTIATAGVIEGRDSREFTLPVAPPGPGPTHGERFSIESFVQIELDVPWAKDPKIRIPVTLPGPADDG